MTNTDPQQSAKAMAKFADAMNKRDLTLAARALSEMVMSDMLTALSTAGAGNPAALTFGYLDKFATEATKLGPEAGSRIRFAIGVVQDREIKDFGLPLDEVNQGRRELGCTPLDDAGVQAEIDAALNRGRMEAPRHSNRYISSDSCCGPVGYAWTEVLVRQRQIPGGSLNTNKAAAAHYMLARYHVCAAKARVWHMKAIIAGYEMKKRMAIKGGDREMRAVALTPNPPFPPDFAVTKWANKGAEDGDRDRLGCNSQARLPLIAPTVNDKIWAEIPREGR